MKFKVSYSLSKCYIFETIDSKPDVIYIWVYQKRS